MEPQVCPFDGTHGGVEARGAGGLEQAPCESGKLDNTKLVLCVCVCVCARARAFARSKLREAM